MKLIRILMIWLCFTTDIRLRADVEVLKVSGNTDLASQGKTVTVNPKKKSHFVLPFEAEVLDRGTVQLQIDNLFMGAGRGSHLKLNSPNQVDFFKGQVVVRYEGEKPLLINTLHGVIEIQKGHCLIDSQERRTTVTVVADTVALVDRASRKKTPIDAGYEGWIGGLKPTGEREIGMLEAAPLDNTVEAMKYLSSLSDEEAKSLSESLAESRTKAVTHLAAERAQVVKDDFDKLQTYLKKQEVRRQAEKRERDQIRKVFRARAMGEDAALPERLPASEVQEDSTEN